MKQEAREGFVAHYRIVNLTNIILLYQVIRDLWEKGECLTYRTQEINQVKGVLWILSFHELTLIVAKDKQAHILVQSL